MKKSTITKEELQLMELHHRYLTDRIIASHLTAIQALYQIAIPTVVVTDSGTYYSGIAQKVYTLQYDPNTLYEVDRINEIIIDYIRENYEELMVNK